MGNTDKHSVLLHFQGEYKELYDNIRKKASELQYKRKTPDAMLIGRHDNKTSPVEPNKW